MKLFLQILVGTCLANLEPLFFDLNGRETRCFIEEMPNDTMMTGTYHAKVRLLIRLKFYNFE